MNQEENIKNLISESNQPLTSQHNGYFKTTKKQQKEVQEIWCKYMQENLNDGMTDEIIYLLGKLCKAVYTDYG